jgi:hypothetical protein
MGMCKVGGWFLIGLILPACVLFLLLVLGVTAGSAEVSLPVVATFVMISWGATFLLRRYATTSTYYDPRHAHRLFTPYYDKP